MDVPASAFWPAEVARRSALDRPRLSVVVVNYVHWDDTIRLVRQLRRSRSFGREAEVVIVDNHSPPHPLIPRLRRAHGVSLRRWRHNRGFAVAANEGCRLSRGEWLLLLNPDVSVPDGFLDTVLVRASELRAADPRAGIAGFRLADDDGSWQLSTGRFPTLAGTLLGRLWPRARRKYTAPMGVGRQRVDWVTGCCMLIRRDCWRGLGGLDERFFLYYEDVDLCRRASRRGWSVWYDPALTVTHHRPLHGRSVPPHVRLITRHALLTYAHTHWPQWQAALLGHVVRLEARLSGPHGVEIERVALDLARGDEVAARARLLRAVKRFEEGLSRAPFDRHPVVQPARLAGGMPGQCPPARAAGS
jgi:GT2 family glycosyltransferase